MMMNGNGFEVGTVDLPTIQWSTKKLSKKGSCALS